VLLPPLSPADFFAAYVLERWCAASSSGSACSRSRSSSCRRSRRSRIRSGRSGSPLLGSAILGTMGLIAGIWAEKFDQLAGFQNFIIVPLTFLSGVFYSIHSLPPFWQVASRFNPFFYMIDGFRYGFFGLYDVPPAQSLAIVSGCCVALSALTLLLLKSGWKLRH
jgi:ABC-2 type transport system permease protein